MDSMRLQSRTLLWMRFDLVGLNNPAIEDARLKAGFFLVIVTNRGSGSRPRAPNKEPIRIDGTAIASKRPVVALEHSNNPKELVMN
jgi:hypothetical protein